MKRTVRRAAPVLAVVAGVALVTCGPAVAASRAGSSAPAAAPTAGAGRSARASVASGPAAAKIKSYKLSGRQHAVSCMTLNRCVTIGSAKRHGTVLTANNGKQGRVTAVTASRSLSAISCPPSTYAQLVPPVPVGCWITGTSSRGTALLVKLSPTGKVTQIVRPPAPSDTLEAISCNTINSCGVAGVRTGKTPGIEIGEWNGKTLTLNQVTGPTATKTVITAMSCFHVHFFCEAVGHSDATNGVTGLVLTIDKGVPGTLSTTSDFAYTGVGCAADMSGACSTVGNSTIGTSSTELFGIDCDGPFCTEAGKTKSAKARRFVGVLITGCKTSLVNATKGFADISRRGPGEGFAAVGPGPKASSVLTLGLNTCKHGVSAESGYVLR